MLRKKIKLSFSRSLFIAINTTPLPFFLNPTFIKYLKSAGFLHVKYFTKNKTCSFYTEPSYTYFSNGSFLALVGFYKIKKFSILLFIHNFLMNSSFYLADFLYKNTFNILKIPVYGNTISRFYKIIIFRENRKYRRIKKWLKKNSLKKIL